MKCYLWPVLLVIAGTLAVPAHAAPGSQTSTRPHQALINKLIAAATVRPVKRDGPVIKIDVREQETTSDGVAHKRSFTAWINPWSTVQRRLQLNPSVIIGFAGRRGWATIRGKEDRRPQTPMMASGTLNAKLFAYLLPFSLEEPGVAVTAVEKTRWQKKPVLKLRVEIPRNFFTSPIMNTEWSVIVDAKTLHVLVAQFLPPKKYLAIAAEGMRYEFLKHTAAAGLRVPTYVVIIALQGAEGIEAGHTAVDHITVTTQPYDPSLFLSPKELKRINEG